MEREYSELEKQLFSMFKKLDDGHPITEIIDDIAKIESSYDRVAFAQRIVEKLSELDRINQADKLLAIFSCADRLYVLATIADHDEHGSVKLLDEIYVKLKSVEDKDRKSELTAILADLYSDHNLVERSLELVRKISDNEVKVSYFQGVLENLKLQDKQQLISLCSELERLIDKLEPQFDIDDGQQYQYRLLAVLEAKNDLQDQAKKTLAKITSNFHLQKATEEIKNG